MRCNIHTTLFEQLGSSSEIETLMCLIIEKNKKINAGPMSELLDDQQK